MMSVAYLSILLSLLVLLGTVDGGTNKEGLEFLKENREKPGVIELESGLQYKVLRNGTGLFHPKASTSCSCHYKGELLSGEQFDSSYDRGSPTTFAPNQVIPGWTEAMQLMVEGDKWEMYIKSELGYGDRGSPPKIPGGSVLVFVMEIIEILGNDKRPAMKCDAKNKERCNEKEAEYIDKISSWDTAKVDSEVKRIDGMINTKVQAKLSEWMHRRLHILRQLGSSGNSVTEEL